MAAQKRELAKKEVALHMMLKHRHVVQLFHAFQVEDLTILTLELCVGGVSVIAWNGSECLSCMVQT